MSTAGAPAVGKQVSPPQLVLHHQLNIVAAEPEPLLPAGAAIPLNRQLPPSLRRLADLPVDIFREFLDEVGGAFAAESFLISTPAAGVRLI
jgi:hypothetical protein